MKYTKKSKEGQSSHIIFDTATHLFWYIVLSLVVKYDNTDFSAAETFLKVIPGEKWFIS